MSTKIEWTNETWNFQGGCTPVSEGCLHCAAARSAELCTIRGCKKYTGLTKNGKWTGELRFFPEELDKPLHWKKPRIIFPDFMSDLFHPSVPFEWIDKVFDIINLTPQHIYQLLTKRIHIAKEYIEYRRNQKYHRLLEGNFWLGVTCENQKTAEERIPILLQIPAAVRFLSLEPLMENIDLLKSRTDVYCLACSGPHDCNWEGYENEMLPLNVENEDNDDECIGQCPKCGSGVYSGPTLGYNTLLHSLNWVIIGCESINGRVGRLFMEDIINDSRSGVKVSSENIWWNHVRNIVEQCKEANVPVFIKQGPLNGKVEHDISKFPADLRIREYPK